MDSQTQLDQHVIDFRRHQAIEQAVQAADRIVVAASGDNQDELYFLTATLVERFARKLYIMANTEVVKKARQEEEAKTGG